MARYHINKESGDAGLCRAEIKCPFGSPEEHYDSPLEAQAAFERSMSGSFIKRSSGFARKALIFGGMAVTVVALAGCSNISTGLDDQGNIVTPDNSSISQPQVADANEEPGPLDKAEDFVKDHPITPPSEEQIERWLSEKTDDLKRFIDSNSSGTAPLTYETDGIYFQGKNLTVSADELEQAQRILENLTVQSVQDNGDYDRAEHFGRSFSTGIAGAIEHRDVPNATFKNDSPQARVVSGSFVDPYTGESVIVTGGDSTDASIDHLVPLKEAWISGADDWTPEERKSFANDLNNLVYTDFSVNSAKGSKDATAWIPSYEPSQCIYAVKMIEVKGSYNLSIDSAEKAALQQIINTKCVS